MKECLGTTHDVPSRDFTSLGPISEPEKEALAQRALEYLSHQGALHCIANKWLPGEEDLDEGPIGPLEKLDEFYAKLYMPAFKVLDTGGEACVNCYFLLVSSTGENIVVDVKAGATSTSEAEEAAAFLALCQLEEKGVM